MFFISDSNYNSLSTDHQELLNNYQILTGDYDTLFSNYQSLSSQYDSVCSIIKQSILPVQYSFFAEAVRRNYMSSYISGLSGKEYWKGFIGFCRDIVLHDSVQYNSFFITSGAFSDALKYGSNTMYLADYVMSNTFYPWLPNWGVNGTENELTNIDIIIDWCIDEMDYEYDGNITVGQESFVEDYIKFPVETAFRTMGDCEDQAVLTSTYLESCGFETALLVVHDPENLEYPGGLFHVAPLVHIDDVDAFKLVYPLGVLMCWSPDDPYILDGYTWCLLDTTWDVPFGSEPSWFNYYRSNPPSGDDMTFVFCDMEGTIT